MGRRMRFLLLGSFALLMVLSVVFEGAAYAQGPKNDKNKAKRLTWDRKRVEATLAPGTAAQPVTVRFTSNRDLGNFQLRVSPELAPYVTVSTTATSATAGTPVEVQVTLRMPAANPHTQGGVIQVRSGQRNEGKPLQIKVRMPRTETDDDDGE